MRSADPAVLSVSVVYLRPGLTFERSLRLPAPAAVGTAIEASGIRGEMPELSGIELEVGVFSRRRALADALHDGDRVEIYRPLTIDPKQARRVRAVVRRRRRSGKVATAG